MINLNSYVKTNDCRYGIVIGARLSIERQNYKVKIYHVNKTEEIVEYRKNELQETTIEQIKKEVSKKYGIEV